MLIQHESGQQNLLPLHLLLTLANERPNQRLMELQLELDLLIHLVDQIRVLHDVSDGVVADNRQFEDLDLGVDGEELLENGRQAGGDTADVRRAGAVPTPEGMRNPQITLIDMKGVAVVLKGGFMQLKGGCGFL